MDKMTDQEGASLDIVNENIQALQTIFPEAFTEGKVDFEALRQLLGDAVDEEEEKYGLNWFGKKKARQIALTSSTGTLRPCPEESVDWDTTQNLFIEGDNLEVLKLLQKSYANQVKMIYIDPPYNTGKEFIYPDKFQDNLDTYLRYTGQKGEEGVKTSSNTESSGRYHTNWLNMMYPRLKLARNLLRDDGIIFISIDDGEVARLKNVCDEIFGEENFIGQFAWKSRVSEDTRARTGLSSDHEYIVCYRRIEGVALRGVEKDLNKFKNPDHDKRGPWRSADMTGLATKDKRPNLHYDLINPKTNINYGCPPKGWRFEKSSMAKRIEEDRVLWPSSIDGRPRQKLFLNEMDSIYKNISSVIQSPSTSDGTKETNSLLGSGIFDFPKPSKLIELFIQQSTGEEEEIILDFFAGSCSSAHAVLNYNKNDNRNRKFIMVQLPEPCEENSEAFKAGFKTIPDIGKERIRRVAEKIKKDNPDYEGDLGFKVFKLDSSNIRAWDPDRNDLEGTLLQHTEHLVPGRTEEDILYELLLKRGVDLTVPIEQKEIAGKTVYSIGYGILFACLDSAISGDEVEELALCIAAWHKELDPASDTQVVFRDSAFSGNDNAKTNMTAILEQNGIAHVRSL